MQGNTGLIPDLVTKILHAMSCSTHLKKKKQKQKNKNKNKNQMEHFGYISVENHL